MTDYFNFLAYMHLNGLHGLVKYNKYLMNNIEVFDEKCGDALLMSVEEFCSKTLAPIVSSRKVPLGVDVVFNVSRGCMRKHSSNPYVKSVNQALDYLLDGVDAGKARRRRFVQILNERCDRFDYMNRYFRANNFDHMVTDDMVEEMVDVIDADRSHLTNLCRDRKKDNGAAVV